jgi:hypothetical protein
MFSFFRFTSLFEKYLPNISVPQSGFIYLNLRSVEKMKKKNILITFIGNHDPYSDGKEKLGPILSILKKHKFDELIILFNNDRYWNSLNETQIYCNRHYNQMKVAYRLVETINPIDHNLVYPAMYNVITKIVKQNPKTNFTISITSGTPTMHACWLLLKQGGVIDAKLLQISRENGIQEVTFKLDDYPKIKITEEIKVELTRLSRENKLLKESLDFDNAVKNGFYIPETGVNFDAQIIPAYYKTALKVTNGNATKAAKLLRIEPHTFRKRLKTINGKK